MADIEAEKLKSLGEIFDSIIDLQKLRVDTKKHDIKILENKLEAERIEMKSLVDSTEVYKKQVDLFKQFMDGFEKRSKELNEEAEKVRADASSYFG